MADIGKTLVAYTSKGGATEETAQTIAGVLRDGYHLEVDIANLGKGTPSLTQYRNVIVGAGVRGGKVYEQSLKFLEQDFENRRLAFFICCGGGGDPKTYQDSCDKYVTQVLEKHPSFRPVATEVFGGRMKILGRMVFDNVDPDKIRAWAGTLGKKLAE